MSARINYNKAVSIFNQLMDDPKKIEEFCESFKAEPIMKLLKDDETFNNEKKKVSISFLLP